MAEREIRDEKGFKRQRIETQTDQTDQPKTKPQYSRATGLIKRQEALWRAGLLCDLDLICGSTVVKAHSSVVAAASDAISLMLVGSALSPRNSDFELNDTAMLGFVKNGQTEQKRAIRLPDEYASVLHDLVGYMYHGQLDIHPDNVEALLAGSDYLGLSNAKSKCVDYMTVVHTKHDAVQFLLLGHRYNSAELVTIAEGTLAKNFEEIFFVSEDERVSKDGSKSEKQGWQQLSVEELERFLTRDNIQPKSEFRVYLAIKEWCMFDQENRLAQALSLLETSLRFIFLSDEERATVSSDPLWQGEFSKDGGALHSIVEHAKLLKKSPTNTLADCNGRISGPSLNLRPRRYREQVISKTFHPLHNFKLSGSQIATCIQVSALCDTFVVGTYEGNLEAYACPTADLRKVLNAKTGTIRCLALAPKFLRCFAGTLNNEVVCFNFVTSEVAYRLPLSSEVRAIAVDTNIDILSVTSNTAITFYKASTGVRQSWTESVSSRPLSCALAGSLDMFLHIERNDDEVRLSRLSTQKPLRRLSLGEPITCADISGPLDAVAAAGRRGTISIWRATTGEQLWRLRAHSGSVTGVAFSSTIEILVSCSSDKTVKVWHSETGQLSQTLDCDDCDELSCVALAGARGILAVASTNGIVKVWSR